MVRRQAGINRDVRRRPSLCRNARSRGATSVGTSIEGFERGSYRIGGRAVLSSVFCRIGLIERLLPALRLLNVVRSFSSTTLPACDTLWPGAISSSSPFRRLGLSRRMYCGWSDSELLSRRRFRCSGRGWSGGTNCSNSNHAQTRAAVSSIVSKGGSEEGILAGVGGWWAMRGWTLRRIQVVCWRGLLACGWRGDGHLPCSCTQCADSLNARIHSMHGFPH
jgi:hypothetical protein